MEISTISFVERNNEKVVVLDKPRVSPLVWIALVAVAFILFILYRMKRRRRNNNL